jgi:hypothetical protein
MSSRQRLTLWVGPGVSLDGDSAGIPSPVGRGSARGRGRWQFARGLKTVMVAPPDNDAVRASAHYVRSSGTGNEP